MLKMIKCIQIGRKEDFMPDLYFEYIESLNVFHSNDFQDIYICKHVEKEAYYLLNSIRDKDIFCGVDFIELKNNISAIVETQETDEAILILTEYYSNEQLSNYIKNDNMTLSKQVNNITFLMDALIKLKTITYSFIASLFNHNNLTIDENGDLKFTGLLLLTPLVMNASREDALYSIANTIHMIFTGDEIIDENISKNIPPDISKIILNCLKGNYFRMIDLVIDFKSSNIYKLINPEKEDTKKVTQMRKSMAKKRITYNVKTKGLIAMLLLIPLIALGARAILKDRKPVGTIPSGLQAEDTFDKDEGSIKEDEVANEIIDVVSEEDNDYVFIEGDEVMDMFFNKEIMHLNEKETAVIDVSRYHRGTYSLKVFNDNNGKASYLIGYIDLEDNNFDYVKDRTINLSLWLYSEESIDCSVTLKLGTKEKLLYQATKKEKAIANTWTLHNIEVKTSNCEYIKIYLNVNPKDIVWVDTLSIDILK
ncbi:MAG: hypothetical protein EWM50_00490 [Gottschalkiaceae bacterium]|nr:MAG: hypothetical protein EWM50_00490 [Gottschalkiaceae bacterium]